MGYRSCSATIVALRYGQVISIVGNVRPSYPLSDMCRYVKEKQPFTVSLGPMIVWRGSDILYKCFGGRSMALHKTLARVVSTGSTSRIRDGGAWKGACSGYRNEEVKWWIEVVASSETGEFCNTGSPAW
ncbi:hypothetical protein V6N13_142290 [Hibiscus sabdariffa]